MPYPIPTSATLLRHPPQRNNGWGLTSAHYLAHQELSQNKVPQADLYLDAMWTGFGGPLVLDGVTDNSAIVNAAHAGAVNAVNNRNYNAVAIRFPATGPPPPTTVSATPGPCILVKSAIHSATNFTGSITWEGQGKDATTIRAASTSNLNPMLNLKGPMSLKGLTLDGGGSSTLVCLLGWTSGMNTVGTIRVEDVRFCNSASASNNRILTVSDGTSNNLPNGNIDRLYLTDVEFSGASAAAGDAVGISNVTWCKVRGLRCTGLGRSPNFYIIGTLDMEGVYCDNFLTGTLGLAIDRYVQKASIRGLNHDKSAELILNAQELQATHLYVDGSTVLGNNAGVPVEHTYTACRFGSSTYVPGSGDVGSWPFNVSSNLTKRLHFAKSRFIAQSIAAAKFLLYDTSAATTPVVELESCAFEIVGSACAAFGGSTSSTWTAGYARSLSGNSTFGNGSLSLGTSFDSSAIYNISLPGQTASFTAQPNEHSLITGTTAAQTCTLPTAPPNGTRNRTLNYSTKTWTIAAAGTVNVLGTTGSYSQASDTVVEWEYDTANTTWYAVSTAGIGGAPTGSAGGILTGSFPNPTSLALQTPQFFTPANPTATTSTTLVMAGIGATCTFTPAYSGNVVMQIVGTAGTATAVVNVTLKGYYGTGTAPVNGAGVTGTAFTQGNVAIRSQAVTTNGLSGFTLLHKASLSVGTTYWLDFAFQTANASDAANVGALAVLITEVAA